MRKLFRVLFRFIVLVLILGLGVGAGYLYANHEEIITTKMFLPKLVEAIEKNSPSFNNSLVVESEDDSFRTVFSESINARYHNGVSDVKVEIVKASLLSKGKNQCAFDGFQIEDNESDMKFRCRNEEKGVFINYILDLKVTYTENEETVERKETGMVVFMKSDHISDLLGWRLVKFRAETVSEYQLN